MFQKGIRGEARLAMFLVVAIALAVSAPAFGVDWVEIGKYNENLIYIDADSIVLGMDNTAHAWVTNKIITPTLVGNNLLKKAVVYYEFDCKEKKMRYRTITLHYIDDTSEQVGSPYEWTPITENAQIVYKYVCKYWGPVEK